MAEYDTQDNPNVDEDYLRQKQDADNAITCPKCGCTQAYYWPWRDAGYCPACRNIFNPYDIPPLKLKEDWRRILDEEANLLSPMVEDGLITILRDKYPYGHERFIELCLEMMSLHSRKNYDYAHGGDSLGNFNRVSAIKKLYLGIDWTTPAATALDYTLKQFDAVLWQWSQGYEGQVEGVGKKIEDIYIYWPIIRILLEEA